MPDTSIVQACEKHWPAYSSECNFFVQAVAKEVLVPFPKGPADEIHKCLQTTDWNGGAYKKCTRERAVEWANVGVFVIGVAKAEMIEHAKDLDWRGVPYLAAKKISHGHVVIVTPGMGDNGWPRGYWGQHGGTGMKDGSLSKAFPWKHKDHVDYYVWMGTSPVGACRPSPLK